MSRITDATMGGWTDLKVRQRYKSLEAHTRRLELVMTSNGLEDELVASRTEYEDCLRSIGASLGTTVLNNDLESDPTVLLLDGNEIVDAPELNTTDETRFQVQAVSSKALKIQFVKDCLSQYLNHKDLKTCRLTCADWNHWFKPRLFNNSKLVLRFDSSWKELFQAKEWETILEAFPTRSDKNSWKKLGKSNVEETPRAFSIPKSIELLDFKPSRTIFEWLTYFNEQIKCLKMDMDCPTWCLVKTKYKVYKAEVMVKLLTALPNLEELQISTPKFKGSLLQEGSESFIQLPNLKALTVGPVHYGSEQFDPSSLKELLGSPKNLQTLSLDAFSASWGRPNVKTTAEYFQVCEDVGYFENLTELHLSLHVDQQALELLSIVKFKNLKKLSLLSLCDYAARDEYPNPKVLACLGQLLENISHSLEVLKVSTFRSASFTNDNDPNYGLQNVDFPEMKKLKSLEVQGLQKRDNLKIDFIQKFPNLHSIRLDSRDRSLYGRDSREDASNSDLIYRIFPRSEIPGMPGIPGYRNHWIKNIDLGSLTVTNYGLTLISDCLTAVESIRLRFPLEFDNTSYAFFFWLNDLDNFKHLKELAITCEVMCESSFNYGVRTGLPQFKALRKFTFDCEKCKIRLQEKTVDQGIMKAPSLQFLELRNILIDRDCNERICRQLGKKFREVRFVECFIVEPLTTRMTPQAKKASALADEVHQRRDDCRALVNFKKCGWSTNNWNLEFKGNPGYED